MYIVTTALDRNR